MHTHMGGFQETSLLVSEEEERYIGQRTRPESSVWPPVHTGPAEMLTCQRFELRNSTARSESGEERTRGRLRGAVAEETALALEALGRLRAYVLETQPRMGPCTGEGQAPAWGQSCWGHMGDERPIGPVSLLRGKP